LRGKKVIMATKNITIRMDEELKRQAEELFSELGLSMTTAIIAFTKQAVREQAIPFIISKRVPNAETIAAIREVEKMKADPESYKGYYDISSMLNDIQE
jgi:DNA-damage-inducible protein J